MRESHVLTSPCSSLVACAAGSACAREDVWAPLEPLLDHCFKKVLPVTWVMNQIVAVPTEGSCSRKTQAAVLTNDMGTQCALRFATSAGSQTGAEFPEPEVDGPPAFPKELPTAQGGVGTAAEAATVQHENRSCPSSLNRGSNVTKVGNDHVRIQIGSSYSCLSCPQYDRQKTTLGVSESRDAGEETPQTCSVCNKLFRRRKYLRTHMRVHTGEKPYMCTVCKKQFSHKKNLLIHVRAHTGERPFACPICAKSFNRKTTLMNHERLHSGEKPYVCTVCEGRFTGRQNLSNHEKLHTGERAYACSVCEKRFSSKQGLLKHRSLHGDRKPHVCSVCQKSFGRKELLVRHERRHSGEQCYVCGVCQKGFTQKEHLARHEVRHSGERSHICNLCQKGFYFKAELTRHRKLHSDKKA